MSSFWRLGKSGSQGSFSKEVYRCKRDRRQIVVRKTKGRSLDPRRGKRVVITKPFALRASSLRYEML
jgi:hypothetical protein